MQLRQTKVLIADDVATVHELIRDALSARVFVECRSRF